MSAYEKEIYYGNYFEVETTCGTEIVPDFGVSLDNCAKLNRPIKIAYLRDYLEGVPLSNDDLPIKTGWLGRLSMPGYLDCTAWHADGSERELNNLLDDLYGE